MAEKFTDRLSKAERKRMLRALDRMVKRPSTRSQIAVDREIAQVRAARKSGLRQRG